MKIKYICIRQQYVKYDDLVWGSPLSLHLLGKKMSLFFSPLGWTQMSSSLLNNSAYYRGHFYLLPSVPPDMFDNVMRHSRDQG